MSVRYALAPRVIVTRARVVAASGGAIAVAPAWLVVVLLAQLGLTSRPVALGLAVAVGLVGAARASIEYVRARKRLSTLAIDVEGDGIVVTSARGKTLVPATAIARIVEIEGDYGGLRVELVDGSVPSRFDVPRGGEAFGELRAWLSVRAPMSELRVVAWSLGSRSSPASSSRSSSCRSSSQMRGARAWPWPSCSSWRGGRRAWWRRAGSYGFAAQ